MNQLTSAHPRFDDALDPTFGDNHDGKVVLRFPNAKLTSGKCIAEGPDGKIYVGGSVMFEGDDYARTLGIARLQHDGTVDTAFGEAGYVAVNFNMESGTALRQILFMTIEGEPRIVLCGIDTKNASNILARLHLDGRMDERFGVNGVLIVKLPDNLASRLGLTAAPLETIGSVAPVLCTVADEKIYVVTHLYLPIWIAEVALLIRLDADGSLDTDFNKTGYVAVTNQYWGHSTLKAVLVHDGKITVCGTLKGRGMVARLHDDGTFDSRFADGGFKLFDEPELAFESLTHDGNTGVLVAGWGFSPRQGALVHLNEDGQLDPAFNGGNALFQTFLESHNVLFYGVATHDRKIIVSGRMGVTNGLPFLVVARYHTDGTLDLSFGKGTGWASTQFDNYYPIANAMALQKDGNVLIVADHGYASSAALIARFLNTAT